MRSFLQRGEVLCKQHLTRLCRMFLKSVVDYPGALWYNFYITVSEVLREQTQYPSSH